MVVVTDIGVRVLLEKDLLFTTRMLKTVDLESLVTNSVATGAFSNIHELLRLPPPQQILHGTARYPGSRVWKRGSCCALCL